VALSRVQEANADDAFGVSGAIIDNNTGRVIVSLRNRVLGTLQESVQLKPGAGAVIGATRKPLPGLAH